MRMARIKPQGHGFFHCISRIVAREFLLEPRHREKFCKLMRKVEFFCGVRILTHTVLSNHSHMLVEVPERQELTEAEVLERVGVLYGPEKVEELEAAWTMWRKLGEDELVERDLARFKARMYDISEFMKTLKQRYTQWYNSTEERTGPLWEDRFKSVLVEDSQKALLRIAAYIDLNSVRAGIVEDPKDYRWNGYAEAVAGKKAAREGLSAVLRALQYDAPWKEVSRKYRVVLYCRGQKRESSRAGKSQRTGFDAAKVKEVLREGGKLKEHELLRCRVRYFTDGVVFGSKEFVNGVFKQYRSYFSEKRKDGARKMRHGEWGDLHAARNLRLEVITVSGAG